MRGAHCAATTTHELPKRTQLGYRTFRYAACRRQFNERTGTPYNYLEFPTDIVLPSISVKRKGTVPVGRPAIRGLLS